MPRVLVKGVEQRSEVDQQRIGHVGQQNFAGRGGRGGRDGGRNIGTGDATGRREQQYHAPGTSDRGRQPRQSSALLCFLCDSVEINK